jgi:acetyl esterase/lipase
MLKGGAIMAITPKVKPLCPPEEKPRYEDIVFAETSKDNGEPFQLKMDIYQSPNQTEKGPCIVYYFGGGWMWGEYKQVTQKAVYCRDLVRLTKLGYTIVSPAYRLGSEAAFPACIHDCKAVIRFLKANADEYNIDPERIGVLGNSAGGHLAAMVAMSANNPEMEGDVGGNLEYSSDVKAAAIFYAPTDLVLTIQRNYERIQAELEEKKDLVGTEIDNVSNKEDDILSSILGYGKEGYSDEYIGKMLIENRTDDPAWKYIELARKCSPASYVSADCPPMIFLHGGQDIVVNREQSTNIYLSLEAAGADVLYVMSALCGHGPSLGKDADRMAYEFLKDRL